MEGVEPKSQASFKRAAGRVVLDFVNTVEERPRYSTPWPAQPPELLTSPERLITWCEESEVIGRDFLARFSEHCRRYPAEADRTLTQLIALREQLFKLFWGHLSKGGIQECDLVSINSALTKLPPQSLIAQSDGTFALQWVADETGAQVLVATLIADAVALLTSERLARLRICAADDCGWLFLNTSNNGLRRWCDMADCGNREKQRRFQVTLTGGETIKGRVARHKESQ
jgi:predicted RNA-binding Zn ribbon-like protein